VTTAPAAPPAKGSADRGRALRKARSKPAASTAARECPPTPAATSADREPLTPTLSPAGGEGGRTSLLTPTPTPSSASAWTPTLILTPPDQTPAGP